MILLFSRLANQHNIFTMYAFYFRIMYGGCPYIMAALDGFEEIFAVLPDFPSFLLSVCG